MNTTPTDLLVAAGRTPNTHDIGLEAAGVELTGEGYIPEHRRRVLNPRIGLHQIVGRGKVAEPGQAFFVHLLQ